MGFDALEGAPVEGFWGLIGDLSREDEREQHLVLNYWDGWGDVGGFNVGCD